MKLAKFFSPVAVFLALVMIFSGCSGEALPPDTVPSTQISTAPTPEPTEPSTEPTTQAPEIPGPSLLDFLKTAAQPVGTTMYIWGGGWNEEDTAAGIEAVTLGLSPQWAAFAAAQDKSYNYKNHRYQIHDGLDCSGYVGWAVYNTLETENGLEGYVSSSTGMAQALADRGLGTCTPAGELDSYTPGDIMSMKGHVWICVGACSDGSVLLLHSSPPGVRFCGTRLPDGSTSEAISLAEKIMKTQYPQWYARYPDCASSCSYLQASALRWREDVLSDELCLRSMGAEEVAELLFPELF